MRSRFMNSILIAACLSTPSLFAQTPISLAREPAVDSLIVQGKSLVDSGYLEWKTDEMLHGYSLLQRAETISSDDKLVEYYLAFAGYRLMTYGMAMKDSKLYDEFADQSEKRAIDLSDSYNSWTEPKVLLASIYGIEMAQNWMKGPLLGPRSNSLVSNALSMDSTNPRVYLILGGNKLNTPAVFGGSTDEAIKYFDKSISLFEQESASRASSTNDLSPDWGYVDALTWLGIAYEKQERYSDALAVYEKTLQLFPDFARAKYSLIPDLKKKMAGADGK